MNSITVIIPTYNRIKLLKDAIKSANSQTLKPDEIIVVDDCSSDGTSDFVTKNYPNVILITLAVNSGAANARNEAIRIAKGDLIAFLDSDDLWHNNYLRSQVYFLTENPHASAIFSNHVNEDENGKRVLVSHKWPVKDIPMELIMGNNFINTMSLFLIKRKIFLDIGLLNENLRVCHDREFYIKSLKKHHLVNNPNYLVVRRKSTNQLTRDLNIWYKEVLQLIESYFDSKSKFKRNMMKDLALYKTNEIFYNRASSKGWNLFKLKCQVKMFWFGLFITDTQKRLY